MAKVKKNKQTYPAKEVVYLLGAGATQADVGHRGGEKTNLLMKDSNVVGPGVATRVLRRANIDRKLNIREETDIEKLISLLNATGIDEYKRTADDLREAYYREILESLSKAGILEQPDLAIGLLQMHKNVLLKKSETLSGIINLNHDNLFQVASQETHGCINLGFDFNSSHFKRGDNEDAPLILQLHGSFSWFNTLPIEVSRLDPKTKYDKDILWIPPTTLKEAKDYPYNKLLGLAYELLLKRCKILRIIGCSLSQNDWNIISLIFSAQYNQYRSSKTCFNIELIMDKDGCRRIINEFSYLKNIIPTGHLKDGDFHYYKEEEKVEEIPKVSDLDNPFKYWLKTKVKYHIKKKEFDSKNIGKTLKTIIEA